MMGNGQIQLKIRTMKITLGFSVLLMGVKFYAYFITGSNAILTDAFESIINVTAGGFALFSVYYAAKPRDKDHPYGHGKIEYLSAGFEGGLILIAGFSIVLKSGYAFFFPHALSALDTGTVLSAGAGICNYLMGYYLVRKGKAYNSVIMIADGKHLISDTVSSIGLVIGLLVMYFTGIVWLDNLLALVFGAVIINTGYKLIRESVNSLLDEADYKKLQEVIEVLNKNRRPRWVDMHNLRVLKYGSQLHVDAHLTLPWYDLLEESHKEVAAVEKLVTQQLNSDIEFFIHADPCLPVSCPVCSLSDCTHRKAPHVKTLIWNMDNLLPNMKHTVSA